MRKLPFESALYFARLAFIFLGGQIIPFCLSKNSPTDADAKDVEGDSNESGANDSSSELYMTRTSVSDPPQKKLGREAPILENMVGGR